MHARKAFHSTNKAKRDCKLQYIYIYRPRPRLTPIATSLPGAPHQIAGQYAAKFGLETPNQFNPETGVFSHASFDCSVQSLLQIGVFYPSFRLGLIY